MFGYRYLAFVAATMLCWGVYAPILQSGQKYMGFEGKPSRIEPLICVGIAYFLVAVLVPVVVLFTKGETGRWSIRGFTWSFVAGIIGAFGAVGMIVALENHGNPVYVVPLVFGGAPIINTIVTMAMNRSLREASYPFYAGVAIVALGAAGVMFFKPPLGTSATPTASEFVMVMFGICLTAVCWGGYGPVLHRGQAMMSGSRLRPFICVGLAYFVVAVIIPLMLQNTISINQGRWTVEGVACSIGAGAAGALGALGIIYAFNFGGRPIVVMPLVFGGVPIVNTFFELVRHGQFGQVQVMFFASLLAVILGAVTVLLTAPRGTPHAASSRPAASSPPTASDAPKSA
jgi:hypothetical protein